MYANFGMHMHFYGEGFLGRICKPRKVKNYDVFIRTCKRPLSTQHLSNRGSHYLPSKSKNQRPHRSQDALQVLQGHLGETSPTSYFADEKNLRPWRPPASKKLHLQPRKVCQPLGTDTWGGVLSLPLSFSRAPPGTPACSPPQDSSPRQDLPAGVFTLTPLSWRWGPSILRAVLCTQARRRLQWLFCSGLLINEGEGPVLAERLPRGWPRSPSTFSRPFLASTFHSAYCAKKTLST